MLIYRTDGPWGVGVGAPLAAAQVDSNFYDVSTRVQFLELNSPQPVQITSFSALGDQFYVHMSDGTVHGPLTLPTASWFFRGPWLPNTGYAVDDVVNGPDGVVYLVAVTHTSATTFDPGANDGLGNNFYAVLLSIPGTNIPKGGGSGFTLRKKSPVDFDVMWDTPGAPFGGTTGQVLQKNTSVNGDASWGYLTLGGDLADVLIGTLADKDYLRWDATNANWVNATSQPVVLRSSSWSPVVGNAGAFMVLTNGSASATVVVPSDSTQGFPIGSELNIHQDGTGTVLIVGEAGVAILKHVSFSNQLLGQYATATVKKTGVNEWRLFGLLAGA
jgi:hypothetical protein